MSTGTAADVHQTPDGCRRLHAQATDGRTMDGTRARALLGVSAHATPDELRQAFRRRALSTHPDVGGDAARFDETVVAFRSLAHAGAAAPTVAHEPFDSYDSEAAPRQRRARPNFAEILERVTAAAAA